MMTLARICFSVLLALFIFEVRLFAAQNATRQPLRAQGTIVFSRTDQKHGIHIYRMNANGAQQKRLIENFGVRENWDFDATGNRIVSASGGTFSLRTEFDANAIYVRSRRDSKKTQLYKGDWIYAPSFSADGKRIVCSSGVFEDYGDSFHVTIIDHKGKNLGSLLNPLVKIQSDNSHKAIEGLQLLHRGIDRTPRFSPNGAFIVYSSGGGANPGGDAALKVPSSHWDQHIFVVSADGGMGKQLTVHPNNFEPEYSPDGRKIVFVSTRDGNEEIYVMNSDGSEQTRLTKDPARDNQPTWSPDGKFIAWVSNRTAKKPVESRDEKEIGNEIYRMEADGTGQSRLTNNSYDDRKPQWLKRLPLWKSQ